MVTLFGTLDAYRTHEIEVQKRLEAAALHHWEALELLIEKHEMALASLSDVVAAIPPEDDAGMVKAWTSKAKRLVLPQNFPGWVSLGIARSRAGPIPARTASLLFEGDNTRQLDFRVIAHLRTIPMPSMVGMSIVRDQRLGLVKVAVVDDRARIGKPLWIRADPDESSDRELLSGLRAPALEPVPAAKLTNAVIHVQMFLAPHRGQYLEETGTNRPLVIVFGALVVDHLDALLSEGLVDGIQLSVWDQLPSDGLRPSDLTNAVPDRRTQPGIKPPRIEFAVMGGANWLPKGPARIASAPDGSGRVVRIKRRQYRRDWLIEARPTAAFPKSGSWTRIIATGGVGSTLTFAVAITLAIEGRRRRQAESLFQQLSRADADLRRSSAERQRIVQDLHDQSAQTLTGLSMLLKRTVRDLDEPRATQGKPEVASATRESLGDAIEGLDEVSSELRQHMLFMEVLPRESGEWSKSVRRWLDRFQRATDCRMDLEMEESLVSQLSSEDRILVEAVIRELTSNSVRHGKASRIRFQLGLEHGTWHLVCEDDGIGFDPSIAPTGHGLVGLEERMRAVGGRRQVRSEPGLGTHTTLEWPVRRGPDPEKEAD